MQGGICRGAGGLSPHWLGENQFFLNFSSILPQFSLNFHINPPTGFHHKYHPVYMIAILTLYYPDWNKNLLISDTIAEQLLNYYCFIVITKKIVQFQG